MSGSGILSVVPSRFMSSIFGRPVPHVLRAAVAALVCAGSIVVASRSASAGSSPDWDDRGQICVDAAEVSVLFTTSFAANFDNLDDPWADPIGPIDVSYTPGLPLVFDFTVPDGYFDGERSEAGEEGIMGFYLMSAEFVDDCTTRAPVDFSPCFETTVGPNPWALDLGGLHLFFFLYADEAGVVDGDQDSVLVVSEKPEDEECDIEDPDGSSGGVDELIDLIDELDIEFAVDVTPGGNYGYLFDGILERVEETDLPNTR